ncbi:MAG: hypothetical protein GX864_03190 [Mollicutes bacterium]|nr:hypothetical protein [Mollicutes bacterium]
MYLKLNKRKEKENIEIKGKINIPKGFLLNTKIKSLKCYTTGLLKPDNELSLKVIGEIKTSNIYPFELEIHDNIDKYLQNDQITLDINLIVWENIILEIPINFMDETSGLFCEIIPESGRSE